MSDMEKVIDGLRICFIQKDCDGCPYQKELKAILDKSHNDDWHCPILDDALALLKEQEEVEPKKTAYQRVDHTIAYRYRCGMCDMSIFPSYKYCPFCGQAVKWE